MKGTSENSLNEFFPPGAANHFSTSSLANLLKTPSRNRSKSLSSSCLTSSVSSVSSESVCEIDLLKPTNTNYSLCEREAVDGDSVSHRRSAANFVLELVGPNSRMLSDDHLVPESFISSEELPVPTFAVDRNLNCTLWNQKMAELSNWSREDVSGMKDFLSRLFCREGAKRRFEDVLKASMYGQKLNGCVLSLLTKTGSTLEVAIFSSIRTDPLGSVTGVVCVVMPQRPLLTSNSESFGSSDSLSLKVSGDAQQVAVDGSDLDDIADKDGSLLSNPQPRVLVFDSLVASRNFLASQLERCGLKVVCASSSQEATWRFEQCLVSPEEGPPFAAVFGELQLLRSGNYSSIRQMKLLEDRHKSSKTVFIATTNMNRWDLAGMDYEAHDGITAGIDAVLPDSVTMQQLRVTLRKLGLKSKYLDVPSSLPRALSGALHNPLNMSR